MEWSRLLQYRFDLFLWTLGDLLTPLISLAIWYNVALAGNGGLTSQETITYYIFASFVLIATGAWGGFFLSNQILNGELVLFLVRPFSVFLYYAINNIVEKSLKLLLPTALLIFSLAVWPEFFDTSFLQAPVRWLFFGVAIILGAIIYFILDIAFGLLAFWLEDANQIRAYIYLAHSIASGLFVPIAFMPASLQQIINYLPFRYIISFPLEILLGKTQGAGMAQFFGLQFLWIAVFVICAVILWSKGLKRYAIPGQ